MSNCTCGAKLRPNNTKGTCYRCSAIAAGKPREAGSGHAGASTGGTTRKQFKTIATALGFDADALIDGFCAAWLARIKASVAKAAVDDSDDDYALPDRKPAIVESARAIRT